MRNRGTIRSASWNASAIPTLSGFLRALKERDWGAGRVLNAHDARRRGATVQPDAADAPMTMAHMQVLPGWIDYNGHMTESRYLFAASETSDAFLRFIGADMDYVAGGHSYYTAEPISCIWARPSWVTLTGSMQVLSVDEKRLHIFIRIMKDGAPVATLEQMLLHVDMKAGRACPAAPRGDGTPVAHPRCPCRSAPTRISWAPCRTTQRRTKDNLMHFALTDEQRMIVDTTRAFVEAELYPHEALGGAHRPSCRWT
jgi:acyl-CoA thioesterase FadM